MAIEQEQLARGMGWFSIGLGVAEVLMPSQMAGLIGVDDDDETRTLLRTFGMREIATGMGLLSMQQPAGWMWGRVAGDLLDLGALGSAMKSDDANRGRVAAVTAAVAGVTALDVACSMYLSRNPATNGSGDSEICVRKVVTVSRPPEELYRFWRDFENLPRFMNHLESVQVIDGTRSHWKAKAPAGMTAEWDAEIVEDRANETIAWRSLEGSDIENSGSVSFRRAPADQGTEVRVELRYSPPGGQLASLLAKLFGKEPGQEVQEDLRAFKQVMETGEVVRSDASIHSTMHPARPAEQRSMA